MVVVLFLLALAMMATGGAAVYFGAPIIQDERGWSMVISGSGVAAAGAVLLGIGVAAQRLRRVEREIRRLGDRISRAGGSLTAGETGADGIAEEGQARPSESPRRPDVIPPSAPSPSPDGFAGAPEPSSGAAVVGRYSSGGNSYVMYSDGSIHADTPSGRHRFGSLDELKSFVAAGGERNDGRPGPAR